MHARAGIRNEAEAASRSLDDQAFGSTDTPQDLVALDDALEALAVIDQRRSRVVELRFFGGLSIEETATVLKISAETVTRDWRLAKVWLLRELSGSTPHGA